MITSSAKPPIAHKTPTQTTLHGISRTDDYSWLRDVHWQEVLSNPSQLNADIRAYLEAENDYTEKIMHAMQPQRDALFTELKSRIVQDDKSVPDVDGIYAYYIRYRKEKQHPVLCRCLIQTPAQEQILLDANIEAENLDYFQLGDFEHSPDHRYLAYTVDISGSEIYALHVLDLNTGKQLNEDIQNIQSDIVWSADSQSLCYVTLDENYRSDRVFLHYLEHDSSQDLTLYQETDSGFTISLDTTRSRRFVIIDSHDNISSELRLIDSTQPENKPQLIQERQTGLEYSIEDQNNRFIIITNADGKEDYKLCSSSAKLPTRDTWEDYIVPADGVLLDDMLVARDFTVLLEIENGLPALTVIATTGESHHITFDEAAYDLEIIETYDYNSQLLRFSYSSMTTPPCVYDYDMRTRTRKLVKKTQIPCGHKPEDYVTQRLHARSKDQAMIAISLLYHKDTQLDGNTPLLLYGYGSYGYSIPVSFSSNRLSLVNRGFIYAIAHIRGGMENGYSWYTKGKLEHKQNTFSDFITVAEYLIHKQFTKVGNITIYGGSAGGMLIGTVLNQRPELFRAAIADVPFVDVLNTICDASLPLTPPEWNEWGNPIKNKNDYLTISSYSPYDNITTQNYPHLLVTAGVSDPRVTYWEPAKWVAKLRAMKTDDNLLLLKTNMSAGHAGASGRFDYLQEIALSYTFILAIFKKLDTHA